MVNSAPRFKFLPMKVNLQMRSSPGCHSLCGDPVKAICTAWWSDPVALVRWAHGTKPLGLGEDIILRSWTWVMSIMLGGCMNHYMHRFLTFLAHRRISESIAINFWDMSSTLPIVLSIRPAPKGIHLQYWKTRKKRTSKIRNFNKSKIFLVAIELVVEPPIFEIICQIEPLPPPPQKTRWTGLLPGDFCGETSVKRS